MHVRRKKVLFLTGSLLLSAVVSWGTLTAALAEKFPDKPITVIIPFSAGASVDVITRVLATEAQKELNVPIVAENMAEAAGIKGLTTAYNANPDGYTLLSLVLPRAAQPEILLGAPVQILNYTYILGFQKMDMLVAVRKDSSYKNIDDLEKASLKSSLSCSIGGMGGTSHLLALILQKELGIKFKMVPFKGSGPSLTALLGGHVDFTIMDSTTLSFQPDRVRGLAIFGPARLQKFPGVPTLRELGHKIEVLDVGAILGPPKIPQDRLQILKDVFTKVIKKKAVSEQIERLGGDPYYLSAEDLYKFTKQGYNKISEYKSLFKQE